MSKVTGFISNAYTNRMDDSADFDSVEQAMEALGEQISHYRDVAEIFVDGVISHYSQDGGAARKWYKWPVSGKPEGVA